MAVTPRRASGSLLAKRAKIRNEVDDSLCSGDIIDMIAEGDEEVEEELRAAVVHLQLHGAASLEGTPAADDESEVVGPQLRVCVGRVVVSVARRRQDGAALNARLWEGISMMRVDDKIQTR